MANEGVGWFSWVWSNRKEIGGYLRRLRDWFRSDEGGRGILIIGPAGVGKTTLARLMSGEFDWLLDDPWEYRESFGIEHLTLKDDPKVQIVVAPGQRGRRESTWVELARNLTAGEYRGVIFVTANGYHSLSRINYRSHPLYAGNKDGFLTAYRTACRGEELAALERVVAALQTAAGKVWLMSVVAKQDLWWPERAEADAFYSSGRYAAVIADLLAARGSQLTRHELVPASLVISNFVSGENEVVSRNCEGYDHRKQVESIRLLNEALDKLREWETQS